jgi:hypothetical protein
MYYCQPDNISSLMVTALDKLSVWHAFALQPWTLWLTNGIQAQSSGDALDSFHVRTTGSISRAPQR